MDAGIETTRTAVAEDVRVRKTVETEPEGTAVVTLEVAVERDEPTTVRVVEPSLGSIPRDEIELDAAGGAEYWRVGDEAVFEREFGAGETHEVVYRVAGVDADRFDALDVDPVVGPAGAGVDELVDREGSDAVRELIAGERDSLATTAPAAGGVDLSGEVDEDDATDEPAAEADEEPVVEADEEPVVEADEEPVVEADEEPESEPAAVDADAHAESPAESDPGMDAADVDGDSIDVDSDSIDVDSEPAGADDELAGADGDLLEEGSDLGDAGGAPAAHESDTVEAGGDAVDDDVGVDEPDEEPGTDAAEPAGSRAAEMDASLAATPKGAVARALVEELREGHVDAATREALREELEPGRSQAVRIKHLQSEVAEFSAYVEMLDEFVDEHGSFEALLERVSSLDEEVEAVRSELDGLADAVEDVDEVSAELEALRADETELETRLDRLARELESVDDRLEEFGEFKERLSGAFQGDGGPDA